MTKNVQVIAVMALGLFEAFALDGKQSDGVGGTGHEGSLMRVLVHSDGQTDAQKHVHSGASMRARSLKRKAMKAFVSDESSIASDLMLAALDMTIAARDSIAKYGGPPLKCKETDGQFDALANLEFNSLEVDNRAAMFRGTLTPPTGSDHTVWAVAEWCYTATPETCHCAQRAVTAGDAPGTPPPTDSPTAAPAETGSPTAAATETDSPSAAPAETGSPTAAATETDSPSAASTETAAPAVETDTSVGGGQGPDMEPGQMGGEQGPDTEPGQMGGGQMGGP
jgi:hypothetical protein